MTTGECIKFARKRAGLTQKELGEKLGISFQTLAQWETGKRKPKYETLERIALALGMEVPQLLGLKDYGDNIWAPPNSSPELINDIRMHRAIYGESRRIKAEVDHNIRLEMEQDDRDAKILIAYHELSIEGQSIAVERVKELAEIPRYQRHVPGDVQNTGNSAANDPLDDKTGEGGIAQKGAIRDGK